MFAFLIIGCIVAYVLLGLGNYWLGTKLDPTETWFDRDDGYLRCFLTFIWPVPFMVVLAMAAIAYCELMADVLSRKEEKCSSRS